MPLLLVGAAGKLPAGVLNAIGAGPNFLTYDAARNTTIIDIPANSTINVFEHAANTGARSFLLAQSLAVSDCETVVLSGAAALGQSPIQSQQRLSGGS